MKNCRHKWWSPSVCGTQLTFRCQKCPEECVREMTKGENTDWKKYLKHFKYQTDKMHKLAHAVRKIVEDVSGPLGYEKPLSTKQFKDVMMVGVDDDCHASSDLLLVPHENDEEYWGTTVWYVPQCTGEAPIAFFLYEGHARELHTALGKILARHKKRRKDADWPECIRKAKP